MDHRSDDSIHDDDDDTDDVGLLGHLMSGEEWILAAPPARFNRLVLSIHE